MYTYTTIFAAAFAVLVIGHMEKPSSAFVTDLRTNVSYHGVSGYGIDSFLNIPFGQDTGGLGRFAPPKPFIPAYNTVFNATVPGPVCPQESVPGGGVNGIFSNVTNISEDCLNLRITRPSSISASSRLPVMVFIYGGGYFFGQIYDQIYNPDQLVINSVKSGTPVIYVAMNYRLGIFGFADSPVLRHRKSLNVGLRDQRLALEWVRENIAVFGGDPDRVTLFGESAGASSVILQMTAFGGEPNPPFQGAIVESFPVGIGITPLEISQPFVETLQATGCIYHDPSSILSLDCLKSLPLETLLQADIAVSLNDSVFADTGEEVFVPVVDGDFIPAVPSTLFQSGRFSQVPMIIGWNNDEGSFLTPVSIETEADVIAFLHKLFSGITNSTVKRILQLYPSANFMANPSANVSAQWTRASRIVRDGQFTCPSLFFAIRARAHQGAIFEATYHPTTLPSQRILWRAIKNIFPTLGDHHKESPRSPQIFLYHLNQTVLAGLLTSQGLGQFGVSHFADIPYVFDEVARFNATLENVALAEQVSGSWSRFATSSFPSSSNGITIKGWQPAWIPGIRTSLKTAQVMVIGGEHPGMSGLDGVNDALADDQLVERCEFLLSEKVLQEIGLS